MIDVSWLCCAHLGRRRSICTPSSIRATKPRTVLTFYRNTASIFAAMALATSVPISAQVTHETKVISSNSSMDNGVGTQTTKVVHVEKYKTRHAKRILGCAAFEPLKDRKMLGLILIVLLVIFLLGGFSGRFGGYGYGYGHGGIGIIGVILIVVIVLLFTGRI